MFATIEDAVFYEYKWSPNQLFACDVDDLFRYFKIIKRRATVKVSERLMDYYTLLNIVHSSKPEELASSYKERIEKLQEMDTKPKRHPMLYDGDAGLDQLDMLKRKRQSNGLQ